MLRLLTEAFNVKLAVFKAVMSSSLLLTTLFNVSYYVLRAEVVVYKSTTELFKSLNCVVRSMSFIYRFEISFSLVFIASYKAWYDELDISPASPSPVSLPVLTALLLSGNVNKSSER